MSASTQHAARTPFAALRNPHYRRFFFFTALAMMADNIEHVISYWVIFQKFQSPVLGGVAVITHWVPFLLFAVISGAAADRFGPRRMIQLAQALFLAVSLAWGVLFITDTLQVWHAVVLLTLHGIAGVLWNPAMQILLYDLVGRDHLQSAIRLNATALTLGILLGPAVGGTLMSLLGPERAIMLNALFYLPLILWLFRAPGRRADTPAPQRSRGFADIALALRDALGNRVILTMTLLAGATSFFVGNAYQAQMPEFAHDLDAEHTELSYNMLLTAAALGALVGGVVLEARSLMQARMKTAIVLAIVWCVVLTAFAVTTSYPLALVLLFAVGFLNLTFSAMAQTLVQLNTPTEVRGRVIGLFNMAFLGLRAFSGITVGFVGSLIGIHWSLALACLVLLAAMLALLAFAMRGMRVA